MSDPLLRFAFMFASVGVHPLGCERVGCRNPLIGRESGHGLISWRAH